MKSRENKQEIKVPGKSFQVPVYVAGTDVYMYLTTATVKRNYSLKILDRAMKAVIKTGQVCVNNCENSH